MVQVSRGAKQYLYDEEGHEYLDCTNGTAHVGHCHPQVGTVIHMKNYLVFSAKKT